MVVKYEKEHSPTLHSIETYNMRSVLFSVVSYILFAPCFGLGRLRAFLLCPFGSETCAEPKYLTV